MFEATTGPIPVNPPGAGVALTRDDVWRALEWKAEAPAAFAAGITACTILERYPDGFLREITYLSPDGPALAQERIIMQPPWTMTFLRLSGSSVGRVVNEIAQSPSGELFVRFDGILAVPGVAHGSAVEAEHRAVVLASYAATWDCVAAAVRDAKRTGGIPVAHPVTGSPATPNRGTHG